MSEQDLDNNRSPISNEPSQQKKDVKELREQDIHQDIIDTEKIKSKKFPKIGTFILKYKKPLQYILMVLILLVAIYVIHREIKTINLNDLQRLSRDVELWDKFMFVVWGLLSFSFCGLYDVVFARHFDIHVPKWMLFQIGWIAQSFNNFIGFGGITGGTLRIKLYTDAGVSEKKSIKLSAGILVSTLLGLFMLSLPAAFGLMALGEVKYVPGCLILFSFVILYLFGERLPIPFLKHKHSPLRYMSRGMRFEALAVSGLEWFVAAIFFAYAIRYFNPNVPWFVGILIYTVATSIGVASLIPGGLGTFDATVLALMATLGYDSSGTVMALLAERLIYTFLPWLLALLSMAIKAFRSRFDMEKNLKYGRILTQMLSFGVLFCGLLLVISVVSPSVFWRLHLLYYFIPSVVPVAAKALTAFFAVLLLILARGINRQVRVANTVTILILLAASATCLLKGLDYEESFIMVVFAVILLLTRSFFVNPAVQLNRRTAGYLVGSTILISVLYLAILNFTQRELYIDRSYYNFFLTQMLTWPIVMLMIIMFFIGIYIILTTRRRYLNFHEPTIEDYATFCEIIKDYGGSMFAHLRFMEDKMLFFNREKTVVMMYRPVKNHILVLGDPIGKDEDIPDALDEMIRWAKSIEMVVSFYEVSGNYLVSYIDQGFRFLKLGEDAQIDLTTFSLSGKKNRGLRHTRGVMEKNGYQFRISMPPHSVESLSVWKAISDDWLSGRSEMQFSVGGFFVPYLQSAPVFELIDAEGKVQAFANQMLDVGEDVLSIDMMRYRKEAPDSVMDMMIISLFEWGQNQGYHIFDLGVSPLANVGNALYSDSRDKLMRSAYEFGNRIYSFGGLHAFKNKFKPNWKPVYLAYKDSRILFDVLFSLIKLIHEKPMYEKKMLDDTHRPLCEALKEYSRH